jgi:uncharacterized SAM-binding protein YcdF (DUF218 family)
VPFSRTVHGSPVRAAPAAARRHRAGLAAGLAAAALLPVATAELLHWQASRRALGAGPHPQPGTGTEAVIVLGYPARDDGRLHPLQRWRCDIAVRSMDPGRDSQLVFTGFGPDGGPSEAAMMSAYAQDVLGVPASRIRTEDSARSTWQNIERTVPLIETADTIKIASDPLHAARARRYLRAQRPDLASRLAGAADYRFGDHWWLKLVTAGYELAAATWKRLRPR